MDLLGIEGVSVSVIAMLLVAYVYVGKVSTVGGLAVGGASRAAHDAKIVALALLGIVSIDTAAAASYVNEAMRIDWGGLLRRLLANV